MAIAPFRKATSEAPTREAAMRLVEARIDASLMASGYPDGTTICVVKLADGVARSIYRGLPVVTREDFDSYIRPWYLAAGWTKVEWQEHGSAKSLASIQISYSGGQPPQH